MVQKSPADLVVQKLRTLIREKARQAPSGSPEHYRLQEMLELSDDALLDTIYSAVEPNPDRVGCPPRETLRELAMRTRPLSDPLTGFANHAGTTPMADRQDALLAASHLAIAVQQIVTSEPGRHVGTVGRLNVTPNSPNVIPGVVRLTIELRDLSAEKLAIAMTFDQLMLLPEHDIDFGKGTCGLPYERLSITIMRNGRTRVWAMNASRPRPP